MTTPDDEFDDFLRKRRPLFGRNDELEPPLELDRVVLRQAREAIESERPHRVFRAPSWGMPVALAATLVLAFTVILRVGTHDVVKKPEVPFQNVSREIEIPAAVAAPAPRDDAEMSAAAPAEAPVLAEQRADSGAVVVDLGADSGTKAEAPARDALLARRLDKSADAMAPARERVEASSSGELRAAPALAASTAPKPEYRRTPKAWLAEIDRLRASGDAARADAELEEYKREHRAYAGAPDR
jgi:hypothetical protein